MAMLPFCGYHMADYFAHWINVGQVNQGPLLPRIFHVNWFRKSDDGKFLWPGYGENARVLKWVFDRLDNKANGNVTPIGILPDPKDLDTTGLKVTKAAMQELLSVDAEGWEDEIPLIKEHYKQFGSKLPKALIEELEKLEKAFR